MSSPCREVKVTHNRLRGGGLSDPATKAVDRIVLAHRIESLEPSRHRWLMTERCKK